MRVVIGLILYFAALFSGAVVFGVSDWLDERKRQRDKHNEDTL